MTVDWWRKLAGAAAQRGNSTPSTHNPVRDGADLSDEGAGLFAEGIAVGQFA
jgi:hypothetical protein